MPNPLPGTLRVAHVVRDYGNLTEPFIDQRIRSGPGEAVVWYEVATRPVDRSTRVTPWPDGIGALLNRAFHRLPHVGVITGRDYRRAEAKDRPDVIHAHYLTTATMVAWHTRAPLIASAYGFDIGVMPRRAPWRHAYTRLPNRVARVLVEGPHMAERVTALGFDRASVDVVPIAIDTHEVAYHEPRAMSRRALRLVSCGRLVEKKGHDTAIRSFAAVRGHLPAGSILEIVGDGPLRRDLARSAASLGLDGAVNFRGALARSDYLELLRSCDMLIAASRTAANGDSEGGAPTTILDAQASGVVVVASAHADLPYLVDDEMTGFLASGDDTRTMAEACERALSAIRTWPAVAGRARRQVEARHSPRALHERLATVYAAVTEP